MNKICASCGKQMLVEMFRDLSTFQRAKYCCRICYLQVHKAVLINSTCSFCGKQFQQRKQLNLKQTCSTRCSYEIRKVVGSSYITTQGYVAIKTHGLNSDSNGYELEHRMIIEKELGRKLSTNEHVHHVNGIKTDNRRENLVVLTNAQHQRQHYEYSRLNSPEAIKKRRDATWGENYKPDNH